MKGDAARESVTSSQSMISTDPSNIKICAKYYLVHFQLVVFLQARLCHLKKQVLMKM